MSSTVLASPERTHWWHSRAVKRFARHRLALVGIFMFTALTLACFVGPWFLPYDSLAIDLRARFAPPFTGQHYLGTDPLGRDLLARLLEAGQVSLLIGFAAMVLSTTLGSAIGVNAGYYGGKVAAVLMRLVDAFLAFPSVFLVLALAALLQPSPMTITVIIAVTSWMEVARIVEA